MLCFDRTKFGAREHTSSRIYGSSHPEECCSQAARLEGGRPRSSPRIIARGTRALLARRDYHVAALARDAVLPQAERSFRRDRLRDLAGVAISSCNSASLRPTMMPSFAVRNLNKVSADAPAGRPARIASAAQAAAIHVRVMGAPSVTAAAFNSRRQSAPYRRSISAWPAHAISLNKMIVRRNT